MAFRVGIILLLRPIFILVSFLGLVVGLWIIYGFGVCSLGGRVLD